MSENTSIRVKIEEATENGRQMARAEIADELSALAVWLREHPDVDPDVLEYADSKACMHIIKQGNDISLLRNAVAQHRARADKEAERSKRLADRVTALQAEVENLAREVAVRDRHIEEISR